MAANNLVGGIIEVKINGEIQNAKGSFKYNIGAAKNEPIVGSDRVHGFKSLPQASKIEGEITDRADLNLEDIVNLKDATVTLSLANGKVISLKDARYTGEGDVETEEGNIAVMFNGLSCEEIK